MNCAFWHEILLVAQTGIDHRRFDFFCNEQRQEVYTCQLELFSHIELPEKSPNRGGERIEDLQTLAHIFRASTRPHKNHLTSPP